MLGLIAALVALSGVAWALTAEAMAGMDAGPGSALGSLSFYVGVWVLMMAAMMIPSIVPTVGVHALIRPGRRERGIGETSAAMVVFLVGYLLPWTTFGLFADAIFNSARALDIHAFSWGEAGPYLAGGVIFVAALYQLTPLKDACLNRCRGLLDLHAERRRDGLGGVLRIGLEHGAWCVGCCWALMAALFALGVMSVAWMVLIAVLIAGEKLLPWKAAASRGIAVLLIALGLSVALAPERVPGLTIPTQMAKRDDDGGEPVNASRLRPQAPYSSWRRIHNGL